MSGWDTHVPVDQRWLGLDRRQLWPSLAVLALVLLWAGIVPAVDRATEADAIVAGSRIDLGDGASFEPSAAWTRDGIALPAAPSVRLFRGGTTFDIRAGGFDGTSEELLDRIRDTDRTLEVRGPIRTLTVDGVEGASTETVVSDADGALFAFASGGTGVEVEVSGDPDALSRQTEEIAEMVGSIRLDGSEE